MKYIISFIKNTTDEHVEQYMLTNNIQVLEHLKNLDHIYLTETDTVPPPDNNVNYIVESDLTKITLVSNNCASIQTETDENWWKLSTLNIDDFDNTGVYHCKNITPVNVYVMDSGLNHSHSEFSGINVENVYTYDESYSDESGHGTAVSSLIAGNTLSLANVNLKVVKVLGTKDTYLVDLLRGLDAIIGSAVNSEYISIVNISWVMPKFTFFENQLEKLFDKNILVVCAAGNADMDIAFVSPASMNNAICVGAYDEYFRPCNYSDYTGELSTISSWSNYGSINVWAPGSNIKVANIAGQYSIAGGTSLASAIHAASVAYALGNYYNLGSVPLRSNFNFYMSVVSTLSGVNAGLIDFRHSYGQYSNISTARTSLVKSQVNQSTDVLMAPNSSNFSVKNNGVTFVKCILNSSIKDVSISGLPDGLSLTDGWIIGKPTIEFPEDESVKQLNFDCVIQFTVMNQTESQSLPIKLIVRR